VNIVSRVAVEVFALPNLHAPPPAGAAIYVAGGFNVPVLNLTTAFGAGQLYVDNITAQQVNVNMSGCVGTGTIFPCFAQIFCRLAPLVLRCFLTEQACFCIVLLWSSMDTSLLSALSFLCFAAE